jgi:hypothetical protein
VSGVTESLESKNKKKTKKKEKEGSERENFLKETEIFFMAVNNRF